MNINIETTYKFTFIDSFNKLDGIYTVKQLLSFYETNLQNVDLFELFYKKAGKTKEEWEKDKINYYKLTFCKIQDVVKTTNIIYIPITDTIDTKNKGCILKYLPQPDVAPYSNAVLYIELGVVKDTELLTTMTINIAEQIAYHQGIKFAPRIAIANKIWLTLDQYEAEEQKRKEYKKKVRANHLNFYSECNRLKDETIRLGVKLAWMEKLLMEKDIMIPKIPTDFINDYNKNLNNKTAEANDGSSTEIK